MARQNPYEPAAFWGCLGSEGSLSEPYHAPGTDANGYLIEIESGIAPASGQSMRPSELPERVPL
jgi:hypothetical protein